MPSATDYPPVHNCTLIISYRTGGNKQLGPQEEAHQQFRHSTARNRIHCKVHLAGYPCLLRKRGRAERICKVERGMSEGKDGWGQLKEVKRVFRERCFRTRGICCTFRVYVIFLPLLWEKYSCFLYNQKHWWKTFQIYVPESTWPYYLVLNKFYFHLINPFD